MSQRRGAGKEDVANVARSILAAWEAGHVGMIESALGDLQDLSERSGFRPFDSLEAERIEALECAVESLRARSPRQSEIRAAVHILNHLANPPLCLAQVS